MFIVPGLSNPPQREPQRRQRDDDLHPALGTTWIVRQVFTHFQNLNLRILIEDLRRGRTTLGNWSFDGHLCPVAHGMASGQAVCLLGYLSQAADLERACHLAATHIGASPEIVYRVVTGWDGGNYGPDWLLTQLEAIWAERRADAEAMQAMLCAAAPSASLLTQGMSRRERVDTGIPH